MQLIDLSQVPDDKLLNNTEFPLSFFELVLKHIFDKNLLETMEGITEFMALFKKYSQKFGREKALVFLQYWFDRGSINDKDRFAQLVSVVDPVFGEEVMTLKQRHLNEGRAEGKNIGAKEQQVLIASKMLASGLSVNDVARFSGLSTRDVERLPKNVAVSDQVAA